MQTIASQTGMIRGMTDTSCRPPIVTTAGFPWTSIVSWGRAMEGMGLQATRMTISAPFVIPARIPPAWFVRKPSGPMGSLQAEPVIRAAAKPAPISTPLTVPIPMRAPARSASILSKTGSPRPGGQPRTTISTIPPSVSPAARASSSRSIIFSSASGSGQRRGLVSAAAGERGPAAIPPSSLVQAETVIPACPITFRATAPAATRPAVSRPEARPPPRWSRIPYFAW